MRIKVNSSLVPILVSSGQLNTLTPIVKSSAERLYDTCVLTSSLWQRSFPSADGNNAKSCTDSLANETGDDEVASVDRLDRCYSAAAGQNGTGLGGMLPSFAQPDDACTATPPTP